jgi:RNase P subunit RPR2
MYCPNCKSPTLTKQGSRWRTIDNERVKIRQFICSACGKYTTEPLNKIKDKQGKVILLENELKEN